MLHNSLSITTEQLLKVDSTNFDTTALQIFMYQYDNNVIYHDFCNALKINTCDINSIKYIPFLPISFFKTHQVFAGRQNAFPLIFESSGTTGSLNSRHYISDELLYQSSLINGFEQFYGSIADYAIIALLPSYLERKNASLVYMVQTLMKQSKHIDNGFYINEYQTLSEVLLRLEEKGQKTLLIGVTFALLEFAALFSFPLKNTIVMETGGMKGRGPELTRTEVHEILKKHWNLELIHSEYGMTELLSQAYSKGEGKFKTTNTMKILIRDLYDPLTVNEKGDGCLNIIDLANINSCSFIATDDLGIVANDGSFEVQGRLDNSDLRGCNLLMMPY